MASANQHLFDMEVFSGIYHDGQEPFYQTWAIRPGHKQALSRLAKRGFIVKGHIGGKVIYYYDKALVKMSDMLQVYIDYAEAHRPTI